MGLYINIDVKEIKRGAVAILNIDDVAFFVTTEGMIAVPNHGDLIDRDDLRKQIPPEELNSKFAIENAHVVIPAERGEDGSKTD